MYGGYGGADPFIGGGMGIYGDPLYDGLFDDAALLGPMNGMGGGMGGPGFDDILGDPIMNEIGDPLLGLGMGGGAYGLYNDPWALGMPDMDGMG